MKLVRLKIEKEFRSLIPEFELNFRRNESVEQLDSFHPFCFAGLNGSGKSNVLEALSNIFYHLECIVNDYPLFAYDPKESNPNEFELEYFIVQEGNKTDNLDHVYIKKEFDKEPQISVNQGEFRTLEKSIGKSYLPDLIVAYSSGENETISLPYIKMKLFQYDQYLQNLKDKAKFKEPDSRMLYIDYEMSQAVLLTILLFFDFGDEKNEGVLDVLQQEINISGIHQFTLNLYNNWQAVISESTDTELMEVETHSKKNEQQKYIGRGLDNIEEYLNILKECSTCNYREGDYTAYSFLINKETTKLIRKKFINKPYLFFSIFQTLHALNERVEKNIHKKEIYNSKGFYTDYKRPSYNHFFYFTHYFLKQKHKDKKGLRLLRELSDGEQQFLHTLGICLMLQNKRTLLLLDEPETHFNPDWRSKFINILRRTLKAGNHNFVNKDIILTSHSPFIISDCFPDKVIVFDKDKQPVNARSKNFRTFGTSVDIIMENIFKKNNTIGDFSRKEIEKIHKKLDGVKKLSKEEVKKFKEQTNHLGDSMEKILLFARLNKLEE